jgi:hypothetical protein
MHIIKQYYEIYVNHSDINNVLHLPFTQKKKMASTKTTTEMKNIKKNINSYHKT